nr:hypothetical protein Iba_chr09dCG16080 [Ipomoea batatas]
MAGQPVGAIPAVENLTGGKVDLRSSDFLSYVANCTQLTPTTHTLVTVRVREKEKEKDTLANSSTEITRFPSCSKNSNAVDAICSQPSRASSCMAESPGKRGLDVLSRRRRREGAFEEPPRSGPRRRRRYAGRQRTGSSPWGGTSVRVWTRPGTGRSGGSRRRVLYRNGVVDGGGRERTLSLRRLIGESGNSGCSISITGGGDRLTITLAHHSSSERTAN